ncbi:MAG: hypothetical protein WCW54_02810 [Candidatus Paceibacterota bacterium]
MKKETMFWLLAAVLFLLFVSTRLFLAIGDQLSQGHWERAIWALVFFSGTLAAGVFVFLILVFLRRKRS